MVHKQDTESLMVTNGFGMMERSDNTAVGAPRLDAGFSLVPAATSCLSIRGASGKAPNRAVSPAAPGIVIEALRDATRSRHAQLGASPAMSRLFDAEYTLQEYRAHLGRLLGFFEPLERAVARAAESGDFVHALGRSVALREDLSIMGGPESDLDSLERCAWLTPIEPAGLYGYAYVILGSMMGGKIIVKRLRASLGSAASFHFYGAQNEHFGEIWASFCSDLDNEKENVRTICDTAVRIFDAYAAWLSGPLFQPSGQ